MYCKSDVYTWLMQSSENRHKNRFGDKLRERKQTGPTGIDVEYIDQIAPYAIIKFMYQPQGTLLNLPDTV